MKDLYFLWWGPEGKKEAKNYGLIYKMHKDTFHWDMDQKRTKWLLKSWKWKQTSNSEYVSYERAPSQKTVYLSSRPRKRSLQRNCWRNNIRTQCNMFRICGCSQRIQCSKHFTWMPTVKLENVRSRKLEGENVQDGWSWV